MNPDEFRKKLKEKKSKLRKAHIAGLNAVGLIISTGVKRAVEDGTTLTIGNMPAGLRPVNPSPHTVAIHDNTGAPDYGHLRILANGDIVLEHPGSVSGHSVYATIRYSIL